ncbi:MAG TPA: PSD1 and planctomycete cytochrome C domain-containing protein [Lacipirellulaceae bacterium]|nr:PSD1 and planctomycete cytochrome C domain-containing protein [Lacipirellulaceae bacterium]
MLLLVGAASRAAPVTAEGQATTAGPPRLGESTATPEGVEFFETNIRPVLVERCYECHSGTAKVLQGGLRLDSADGLRKGGDSGTAIVPYKPDDSLLISALRYESLEMPPSGKLPDKVIDDFIKWVALGAPDPRTEAAAGKADAAAPTDPYSHWAYQRPQKSTVPKVTDRAWARSEIDRFIVAKLEKVGVSPSPQAPPRALLRRVYYDLIGLPPTAKELAEFEGDPSDARYEATVDWLLSVPQYGERWARHWLDIARYADTKGYLFEEDRNYKHAYKYRDWVISSFATDRPYDEFIVAQLAADQTGDPACVPAMGFLTLGRRFLNNRHDIINDRIDVVTRGLMGLTVACARCHDHKYDPISAGDYYALYGVFASSQEKARDDAPPMLVEAERLVDPVIFLRGSPGNRGPKVDRRFLTCLAPENKPKPFQHGSGRLELAQTIASRENPLTARVWVNRVWGYLLGRGLVNTTSDFGSRGAPPTHPELLDWLACKMMDDAWSTKRLIRRIVLSSTYRQASNERPECLAVDPENLLLWRANRRRLDLESLRDSVLAAAGRLDATIGGPSVPLTASPFPTRRAVYGFIERQNLPAFFRTFDFANPNTHTPERPQTVAPQQALFLMNSPFVMEQAAHLAARTANTSEGAAAENDSAKAARIALLFQHALGREPTAEESAEALAFVSDVEPPSPATAPQLSRWEQLAQVLLMSNEFAFVD